MESSPALVEGAIFKMKKTLTGFKWKKKWVRSDGVKVYQWATDVKPGIRTKPKHVYLLSECVVREINASKPHAFCVHENSKNDMMVFAAKGKQQLDQWLQVLTCAQQAQPVVHSNLAYVKEDEESARDHVRASEDLIEEEVSGTENMSKRDLAKLYFEEYDISYQMSDKSNTAIDEKLFPDMLNYIGIQLSNSDMFFSLQSVKNEKEGIYLKDFLLWLDQHPELANSDHDANLMGNDDDAGSTVDNDLTARYHKASKKALSFECDELLRLNHSDSTWLNITEPSHLAGVLDCKHVDLIKSSAVVTEMQHNMPKVSEVVKTWPFEENPKDWNACYQDLLGRVTGRSMAAEKIGPDDFAELYRLCAVQGHFLQAAIAGCTVIVDEYSLPTSMKTAKLLSVAEENTDDDLAKEETEEEVYLLNNLIFRLLGNSSSDKDLAPSVARMQYIISSDEIVSKIAGNDFRSHEAVRKTLVSLSNDACQKGQAPFNAHVLLTTMIDYCGFRLQVFSPIDIDEPSSLLLGAATTENIYVNALSDLDFQVVPALAKAMNMTLASKELLTCMETLNRRNPAAATKVHCQILSRDVQLHRCGDEEKIYLLNFNNFLPPDFPRPESNDVNTRHMRPEYVANYSPCSIDGQAVSTDNGSKVQDRSRTRSTSAALPMEGGGKQSFMSDNSLHLWMRAASHLHGKLIPEIVLQLDTMSVLPLDSHGLTEFLHSRGVNMRCLGEIYKASRAPHVKDLVLCEAIARSTKSLLNQTLRNITRKGRAETIIAEDRKRSQRKDFINHQSRVLASKTAAVIYFFNMVLGHGIETDNFWKCTLPKIVMSKFGLAMPQRDKKMLVFFPQLIQALEYHTNVHFSHQRKYSLASASHPEPFTEDDLTNYDCNFKFNMTTAGIFRRCESYAESFLASNMLPQAIAAFKIRLSTQNIFMRGMTKPNKKVKHQVHLTTYSLALCYFLDKKIDLAYSLCASIYEEARPISPLRGRIATLLMCADFKCGHIDQALRHYEDARLNYTLSLGTRHPVIALLYNTLADLYFEVKAFSHSKLFLRKAIDFTERTLGVRHVVNAGHSFKLGALLLEEASYVEAKDMFCDALDRYAHCAANGAVFGHEISECYHGLAIAEGRLGNISKAISFCKQSLAISTSDDKYITSHAVSCIIYLAEEHEQQLELQETINLYSDAWTIVQAYSKDFELPTFLVIIASRIFSTYINNQPMHFRMLFHTIGAECEAKHAPQLVLDKCSAFIVQELVLATPLDYISSLFKALTEGAENVLSTHSRFMVGTQKSVFGVPCPNRPLCERADGGGYAHSEPDTEPPDTDLPDSEPPMSEYNDEEEGGGEEEGKEGGAAVGAVAAAAAVATGPARMPPPPVDVQVMVVLRMVMQLSVAA